MSETASAIAAKIAFIVERRWGEAEGIEPRDCDGEDPLILTRALVSLVLRSLWPIQSGTAGERQERAQRRTWWTLSEERKRLRALDDPTDAEYLRRIEDDLQELEAWFKALGEAPSELNEADLAKKLHLPVLYDLVYRMGSATIHHSQLAALGSFAGKLDPGDPFPGLPLRFPKPTETDQVLLWAITTYAIFLERAEPAVRLGIGQKPTRLYAPGYRSTSRRPQPRINRRQQPAALTLSLDRTRRLPRAGTPRETSTTPRHTST